MTTAPFVMATIYNWYTWVKFQVMATRSPQQPIVWSRVLMTTALFVVHTNWTFSNTQ